MSDFLKTIREVTVSALPLIQASYDKWHSPVNGGSGICGIIARHFECALNNVGIYTERISENGHFYVLAINDDGQAITVDIPWHLYELPDGNPCEVFVNWHKVHGHTFTANDVHLDVLV